MLRIPLVPPTIEPITDSIHRPMWSVMIPVYNCIPYIRTVIESVLVQDMGAELMQIEVIDDCSTDGDVEKIVSECGKGRVSYFRQPVNKGSLRNFETCIRRARGIYVHILHGDDFVQDGYYREVSDLVNLFPEAGAAFTNFNFVNHKNEIVDIKNPLLLPTKGIIPDFLYKIAEKQLIQPPAVVVKRTTYEKLGAFYAVHFGEDWEMWTRIASEFPIAYSPRVLASYRIAHGMGVSHNSYLSGQNIADIQKVISIIQGYLPDHKKKRIKRISSSHYAVYAIRVANTMLEYNRIAALAQVRGAVGMISNLQVLFWATRFYLMYFIRYKQIAGVFSRKK